MNYILSWKLGHWSLAFGFVRLFNPVKPKECLMFINDAVLSIALFVPMLSEVGPVFTSNKFLKETQNVAFFFFF